MKKLIFLMIMSMSSIVLFAQNAEIEVGYMAYSPNFKNGAVDVSNQYVLLANSYESKFFSPQTEYIDSLGSTQEGIAQLRALSNAALAKGDFDAIPRKDGSYYVTKSLKDNLIKTYDCVGVDNYYYDDIPEDWNWQVYDSSKLIMGYECIRATTNFHGRNWEVWFSPEIPIPNGPWKLGGLPGLILEATSVDGKYSFIVTGIQRVSIPIGPIYLADKYEKTNRKSFFKAKRSFIDNPMGALNAQFGGENNDIESSGGILFDAASIIDFIETDYR